MATKKNQEKQAKVNIVNDGIQNYHQRNYNSNLNYAFQGFKTNKYLTSDRFIELIEENNKLVRKDGKELKGYGLEIELESKTIRDRQTHYLMLANFTCQALCDDLFKFQRDGSLDTTGVECITQIMTKEFIRNNYAKWYDFFGRCEQTGTYATSGRCGMHVNISTALFGKTEDMQLKNIQKLCLIINNNYRLFCELFKRDINNTCYCLKFNGMYATFTTDLLKRGYENDHSKCLNLSHICDGRVEIRLVGGQKNFQAFRNTMEVIFHLVEACKKITLKDVENNNLIKVFENCNKHVLSRLSDAVTNNLLSAADFQEIKNRCSNEVIYDVNRNRA